MLSGQLIPYKANLTVAKMVDLLEASLTISLHTSSYTPNTATDGHSEAADLSNELSSGNGYGTGGIELTNVEITPVSDGFILTSDDLIWTADGGDIPAWRYAVLRVNGELWGLEDPLLAYCLGNAEGADVPATKDGNPMTLKCPATGWLKLKA